MRSAAKKRAMIPCCPNSLCNVAQARALQIIFFSVNFFIYATVLIIILYTPYDLFTSNISSNSGFLLNISITIANFVWLLNYRHISKGPSPPRINFFFSPYNICINNKI